MKLSDAKGDKKMAILITKMMILTITNMVRFKTRKTKTNGMSFLTMTKQCMTAKLSQTT